MDINPLILKAIEDRNYIEPTPIQEQAIPPLLKNKDLLGCAQTGTGKTAAFAIPILHQLSKETFIYEEYHPVKALVLAPTRELAIQIGESFNKYGEHLEIHAGVVYGGVTPKRHIKLLKREPNILVATPGRLLDLHEKGVLDLGQVGYLVLDEADRMLDLGMAEDVTRILDLLPKERQNMLFSATMPKSVSTLVNSILKDPVRIEIKQRAKDKVKIIQQVYHVEDVDKTMLLIHLLKENYYNSAIIFVRTKKKADKVCRAINVANIKNIRAKAIHGDKNQSERQEALWLFKKKEVQILVATDVAARGIDISQLELVVNTNIPTVAEAYIHRIGRTGRAGEEGKAISFCSGQEAYHLQEIEKLQGQKLTVVSTPII